MPLPRAVTIIRNMAYLRATKLAHAFGARDLFSGVDLEVGPKDRVALVGPNGVGKTTLLLILAGLLEATGGEVERRPELTIGYLRQEAVLTFAGHNHSIYEEMLTVFSELRQVERQMREIERAMASGRTEERLMAEYGQLQQLYEFGGGYQYQAEIRQVLIGLGFDQTMWELPLLELSGGQKTRISLGRLLLEKPQLLILDEPTNHLDLAAVEWLENRLRQWAGALIVVSHDRYFLDKIVNRVWELQPKRFMTYRGDYSTYIRQRRLNWEREQKLFLSEKARLEKELAFISKHIAGGHSDIAKGKLKRLTRDIILLEQANGGTSLEELRTRSWLEIGGRARSLSLNEATKRVRDLEAPTGGPPQLGLRLQVKERSGRVVLRSGELEIGYPGKSLFVTGRIRMERHDCVALIGPNGSGKSTFLRTIMGELPPLKGWIKFGDGVKQGYFAQGHERLTLENRVIDEIVLRGDLQEAGARSYLAPFLFRGDEVFKQVSELSGGERGRLALAVLALEEPNLLLLDEPTNHLDVPSQEVLQSVLEQFDGTILLVTHDRYLIDKLANQIWELRDGELDIFEGSYKEHLEAREREALQATIEEDDTIDSISPAAMTWVDDLVLPPPGKKEARRKQRRLQELEVEIEETEAWVEQISVELERARVAANDSWLAQLEDESTVIQARLKLLQAEWEELAGL